MKNIEKHKTVKEFIISLPFEYKKAVLTQARTSRNRPYAFIVAFYDGNRKFMKGPFKNVESAQGHVICNEVKRRLASKYLHPIHCKVKEYGAHLVFLECEELGKADLNKAIYKRTKLEDDIFEVLTYDSNDVVPDPFTILTEFNSQNRGVWIELMVNYCFRWVFGIGDAARRNLMLQRSSGKIYSTDETGIGTVNHGNIWGGKKPDRNTFKLIRAFTGSVHLQKVLNEVERWKAYIDPIRREIVPLSKEVEGSIDKLLKEPKRVFDIL